MTLRDTSYNNSAHWREINENLPADLYLPQSEWPNESTVLWRDCQIHVDRYDNQSSDVRIILHHGLGTNARIMSMIAGRSLARRGYDVTAIDMPYVGMTNTPSANYTYFDWVELSSQFITDDHRNDQRPVVLFGFSVGGMLCYHASCFNDNVIGICGTSFLDLRSTRVRDEISRTPLLRPILETAIRYAINIGGQRIKIPLSYFANPKTISNCGSFNKLLANDPATIAARLPLGFMASLKNYQPQIEPENFEKCPVMFIHCEQDHNIPFSANAHFVGRIKGCRHTRILKGAGHIPTVRSQLDELADAVDSFTQSLR